MLAVFLQNFSQDISLGNYSLGDPGSCVIHNIDTMNVVQGHLLNNVLQALGISNKDRSFNLSGWGKVGNGLFLACSDKFFASIP